MLFTTARHHQTKCASSRVLIIMLALAQTRRTLPFVYPKSLSILSGLNDRSDSDVFTCIGRPDIAHMPLCSSYKACKSFIPITTPSNFLCLWRCFMADSRICKNPLTEALARSWPPNLRQVLHFRLLPAKSTSGFTSPHAVQIISLAPSPDPL